MRRITRVRMPHAGRRLEERGITITECEHVLNHNYYEGLSQRDPQNVTMIGECAGRRLRIWVKPLGNDEYELCSAADTET